MLNVKRQINYKVRAIAIRFEVVRMIVRAKERYTLGSLGTCFPRKILVL